MFRSILNWYDSKFRNKILIPTVLMSLVSVILLGATIFYASSKMLVETEKKLTSAGMAQSSELLGNRFKALKNVSNLVLQDQETRMRILALNEGYDRVIYSFLENRLMNYSIDEGVYNIRIYLNGTDDLDVSKGHRILNETYLENEEWFSKYEFEKNKIYWQPTYKYTYGLPHDGRNVISLIRPIFDGEDRIGLVIIDMLEQFVFDVINKAASSQTYKINLVNQDGFIISTDDKSKVGLIIDDPGKTINYIKGYMTTGEAEFIDANSYIFIKEIEATNWYLLSEVPRQYILNRTFGLARNIISIVLAVFLLIVCVLLMLSNNLTRRIKALSKEMDKVMDGNLDLEVKIDSSDEIGNLQRSFSSLLDKVKDMIEKQYQDQQTLRKAEFSTLQAQINPHFLYNILDMVNWMALENDLDDISYVVSKLARFFRISLSSGKDLISISEELEHIELYLDIQKMRFGTAIETRFNIEEGVENCLTLKLILQPLVENAITHGIQEKSSKSGMIVINAYMEEHVFIEVIDNGVGIENNDESVLLSGFGYKNVNERIRLTFGKPFGVELDKEYTAGTKVIVRLPHIGKDT